MTNDNELLKIMERISTSSASDAEIAKFDAWCDTFKSEEIDIKNLDEINQRVFSEIERNISAKPKLVPLYLKIAAVAAVACVAAGIWLFNSQNFIQEHKESTDISDVNPGKQGATLTLANGKKINLGAQAIGLVAKETGVTISKDTSGQVNYVITSDSKDGSDALNKLETSRGEQTRIKLDDGSIIYLNAASSIQYPTSFVNKKSRKVTLSGEGYFEVAKDSKRPFIVESNGMQVEVLGTHFNINAYDNESISKTTLLEGSVMVSIANMTRKLSPGFEAIKNGTDLHIQPADTDLAVGWKNNLFLFEDEELQSIMRQVERWYDVEVIYKDNISHERFGGGVSKFNTVSKLLKSLEETGNVQFKIEGRKIYVSKQSI